MTRTQILSHLISCETYVNHMKVMLVLADERMANARALGWSATAMQPLVADVQALNYAIGALDHSELPAALLAAAEGREPLLGDSLVEGEGWDEHDDLSDCPI